MPTPQIDEAIERLQVLIEDARRLDAALRNLGVDAPRFLNHEGLAALLQLLGRLKEEEQVFHALARIDFRDDHYGFIRAIDGDTIVVAPPRQLRQWMKDIHVRLYGLETPEKWEELGERYRQHLHDLCATDGRGRLMIVWEREREGTNYAGFPLSTFERGVGHVFFAADGGTFYYVNGLMHLLRFSSLHREGQSLLRGRRHIAEVSLPWRGSCMTELRSPTPEASETFRSIQSLRPPVCLLRFPQLPSLDPRDGSLSRRLADILRESWGSRCPVSTHLNAEGQRLLEAMIEQRASPFDLPLTYISQWAADRHRDT